MIGGLWPASGEGKINAKSSWMFIST